MKRIDLENHFATEVWLDALKKNEGGFPRISTDADTGTMLLHFLPGAYMPYGLVNTLLNLDGGRIAALDAAGIDVAVLSLAAPGVEAFDPSVGTKVARASNDVLAQAIARHPDRFQGYAALAPKDPEAAAAELERCVKELGFKGWNTHCNYGDSYLDEKRYWPVLAKAEELDVPIYVHPTVPVISQFRTYGQGLAGASFGFGAETAMVMMRLIMSGALDAFPKLKVILGHYAEGLPFMIDRVDRPFIQGHVRTDPSIAPQLKRMPADYLKDNMYASTSGNYSAQAFACTRDALGFGHMVLGSDYPFEDMRACVDFLDAQGMSGAESDQLYRETAASLSMGD
jgi:uncharacterized protein